jgi:hypothetical protein
MFRRFLDATDYWFGCSDDSSTGSYDPVRECCVVITNDPANATGAAGAGDGEVTPAPGIAPCLAAGPSTPAGADHEFELKPSLINMVQADLFSGKVHEDASAHLQNFLEKGTSISIKDIPKETILLRLFPFSLKGRSRQWFYSNKINTWKECSTTFLSKFFHTSKTNDLCEKITNF